MKQLLFLFCSCCLTVQAGFAQKKDLSRPGGSTISDTPSSYAAAVAGMQRSDGFIPFYWDARKGKILLERIPELKGVRDVTDHSNRENAYY